MDGGKGDTPVLSSTPCAMVHGKNKGMVIERQHDEHRHGYHYNVCWLLLSYPKECDDMGDGGGSDDDDDGIHTLKSK